jgi:hypothetical protein
VTLLAGVNLRGLSVLETFKTYIIGEWKVIGHAPASILMAVGFISVVLWAAF